jgi:hypothetical protein
MAEGENTHAQLRLIDGDQFINVAHAPADAARLLWGDGERPSDLPYAVLNLPDGKPVYVNPAAVAAVIDVPPRRSRTVSFA